MIAARIGLVLLTVFAAPVRLAGAQGTPAMSPSGSSGARFGSRCQLRKSQHLWRDARRQKRSAAAGGGLQRRDGLCQHLVMVEGKRRQIREREPGGPGGIVAGAELDPVRMDDGPIGDRHDPTARVAARLAEGVELVQG